MVVLLGGGSYRGAVRGRGRGGRRWRGVVVPAGRSQAPPAHRVHAEAHRARVRGHAVGGMRVPAVGARARPAQPLTTRLQGAGGLT